MINGETRRTFLKLMGASVALAGAATIPGCRRPDHKIMAFSREVPEDMVPGKPVYYATSMPLPGGGADGLLIETHEGRPTKVEGNPNHPINRGKSSLWSQASILELYDPDRLRDPVYVPQRRCAALVEGLCGLVEAALLRGLPSVGARVGVRGGTEEQPRCR